jgi:hypothetical protein
MTKCIAESSHYESHIQNAQEVLAAARRPTRAEGAVQL